MNTLPRAEILSRLQTLPGWELDDQPLFIHKTYSFRDFSEAFGFLARIALLAESLGHHPDWSGGYCTVTIRLRTHDADGITALDLQFAERAEQLRAGL
ncbi:MAG: 4a-hydroxytetrahydrobiopterin dehydratase [Saprospiraceae bacterium]